MQKKTTIAVKRALWHGAKAAFNYSPNEPLSACDKTRVMCEYLVRLKRMRVVIAQTEAVHTAMRGGY